MEEVDNDNRETVRNTVEVKRSYPKGVVGLLCFAVVMTPLLLSLGFWQLDRAAKKQGLADQQSESNEEVYHLNDLEGVDWTVRLLREKWMFKKVRVTGQYDPERYLLLDNRTRNGQVGYEVLSIFTADSGQRLLINRGWIKGMPYRNQWPDIDSEYILTSIVGTIYFPSQDAFTLDETPDLKGWPKRVQKIDMQAIAQEAGSDLYPFTLRLTDDNQPGAYSTGWGMTQMTPDKHRGYAFQWFGLAVVLIVMTYIAVRKIIKDDSTGENRTDG